MEAAGLPVGGPFNQVDTDAETAKSCELIYGSEQLGVFKRTLLRTATSQLQMPTALATAGL
jgi:hypothetical protein